MCRPIRALTQARGYSTSKHVLASFGGAGGQHACSIARSLGIKTVVIHKYSSILSAYGMALADRVFEKQQPCNEVWSEQESGAGSALARIRERAQQLEDTVTAELRSQGFAADMIHVDVHLNMRYDGTDTALMTLKPKDSWGIERVFTDTYRQEFGFVLSGRSIIVDDVRVKGIGRSYGDLGQSVLAEHAQHLDDARANGRQPFPDAQALASAPSRQVYFDGVGRVPTAIVPLKELRVGERVRGPAILIDETQTILVEPQCEAQFLSQAVLINVLYDS